ncbi:hypothetical protein SXCC_02277 [Gluconacetobacter sp. SXCC-1]|nr:hypothetical protein SXCC_02277 [Gluconacetobacter sp. SXCC-1]
MAEHGCFLYDGTERDHGMAAVLATTMPVAMRAGNRMDRDTKFCNTLS